MNDFQPHWVHLVDTDNPICCQECGELVTTIWLCYTRPAIWTVAWCDSCAEGKLEEHNGATEQTAIGAGETAS